MAVIVNDMSEFNIDAALEEKSGENLSRTEEKLVEMSNGLLKKVNYNRFRIYTLFLNFI